MKKSDRKNQKAKSKQQDHQDSQDDQEDSNSIKEESKEVKDQIKEQQFNEGPKRWYEDSDVEIDQKIKWTYLEHHGVTFPPPYIPKGICAIYDGKEVKRLNAHEQQLGFYWNQTLGTQRETEQNYRKNFADQFMERFIKENTYTDFNKFDFINFKLDAEKRKEERLNMTQAQKDAKKKQKEEKTKLFGYAIVDDLIQRINGYEIQAPTLFKGRGVHPKAGILKPRIQPQDITLNLSLDAPIPRCPLPGHSWGQIVSKQDSTWLCSYINDAINQSSKHKYIFLAANSKFKGISDRKKYDKARKLKACINEIRVDYMKKIQDKEIRNRQLGTATYLIDTLALRVGNQKGDDEADTVGCCSLRVQHIEALPQDKIKLDFLGKDSMRYENVVKVHHLVWENIKTFVRNKQPLDDLFDKIDAQILNDYLKSLMQGLTAKVFRTYNASITLQTELKKRHYEGLTMEQKYQQYEQANRQVAILCNHQKTPSKKLLEGLQKKRQWIEALKQYQKQLEKHKSLFSKKDKIDRETEVVQIEGNKPILKKFPETKDASVQALKKLTQKIQKEQKNLKKRDEGKQIALGTSKTNYNDPRISVAWCKANQVKVQRVFTKNLLSKFIWAMYTDDDWEF